MFLAMKSDIEEWIFRQSISERENLQPVYSFRLQFPRFFYTIHCILLYILANRRMYHA